MLLTPTVIWSSIKEKSMSWVLTQGQGRRPRVPGCVGTGAAERSYPMSEVRGSGRDELPHAGGQGRRLRGATPCPRSGSCAGAGGPEELLHIQGQEGWW